MTVRCHNCAHTFTASSVEHTCRPTRATSADGGDRLFVCPSCATPGVLADETYRSVATQTGGTTVDLLADS